MKALKWSHDVVARPTSRRRRVIVRLRSQPSDGEEKRAGCPGRAHSRTRASARAQSADEQHLDGQGRDWTLSCSGGREDRVSFMPRPFSAKGCSGEQLLANTRAVLDADQAVFETLGEELEVERVEAQQVQDGGLEVVDAHGRLGDGVAQLVGRA